MKALICEQNWLRYSLTLIQVKHYLEDSKLYDLD